MFNVVLVGLPVPFECLVHVIQLCIASDKRFCEQGVKRQMLCTAGQVTSTIRGVGAP